MLLVLALLVSIHSNSVSCATCFITPDTLAGLCPNTSEPCIMLSQFVASPTSCIDIGASFFKLILLPGNHSLHSTLTLNDYSGIRVISILGTVPSEGVNVYGGGSARLEFNASVSEVRIEHITFIGFATSKISLVYSSVFIHKCSFISGNGTALELEYNYDVTISESKFVSNIGTDRQVVQTVQTGRLYSSGGALFVKDNFGTIWIIRSVFHNNSAEVGGVVYVVSSPYVYNCNMFVTNSSFHDNVLLNTTSSNSANYNDGVLFYFDPGSVCNVNISSSTFVRNIDTQGLALLAVTRSTVLIQQSSFTENHCTILKAENSNHLRVVNSGFYHNTNTRCGSIFLLYHSFLEVADCSFMENQGTLVDGGIFCAKYSHIETYNCSYTNNFANSSGGVFYLDHQSHLFIGDCQFDHNTAGFEGAVVYSKSSFVTSFNSTFISNTAQEGGGVVMCTEDGFVNFTQSTFIQNHAVRNGGVLSTLICNVTVNKSTFEHNSADVGGVLEATGLTIFIIIDTCNFTSNSAKSIGGVGAMYGVGITIMQSTFVRNRADSSGGVFLLYNLENDSTIDKCTFISNEAKQHGAVINGESSSIRLHSLLLTNNSASLGVVYFQRGNIIFNHTIVSFNNGSLYLLNCKIFCEGFIKFLHSSNYESVQSEGGAITGIQSEIHFNAVHMLLQSNQARHGGAMLLSESKLSIKKSYIYVVNNHASISGGGIYCFQSDVTTEGHITFTGNTAIDKGGAIHSVSTTFHIPLFGYVPYKIPGIILIEHNHARKGGGVYCERSSKLYISKDAILVDLGVYRFINNSADFGGALFIADDTNSGTCFSTSLTAQIECTLQIIVLYEFNKPQIGYMFSKGFLFSDNSATIAGQDLYGGLLDRCIASLYAEAREKYVDSDSELTGLPYLKIISNISEETITSDPVQICFCINDTQNCSYEHPTVYAKKGERVLIELVAVDQVGHPVSATVRSYLPSEESGLSEGQLSQKIPSHYSKIALQVVFSQ